MTRSECEPDALARSGKYDLTCFRVRARHDPSGGFLDASPSIAGVRNGVDPSMGAPSRPGVESLGVVLACRR